MCTPSAASAAPLEGHCLHLLHVPPLLTPISSLRDGHGGISPLSLRAHPHISSWHGTLAAVRHFLSISYFITCCASHSLGVPRAHQRRSCVALGSQSPSRLALSMIGLCKPFLPQSPYTKALPPSSSLAAFLSGLSRPLSPRHAGSTPPLHVISDPLAPLLPTPPPASVHACMCGQPKPQRSQPSGGTPPDAAPHTALRWRCLPLSPRETTWPACILLCSYSGRMPGACTSGRRGCRCHLPLLVSMSRRRAASDI
mmetsp:Transcript_10961/g.29715  ORF Transcript_10961/g.29715 Transcript_10961/m.29715 type:complete len:255 (-) Transcript_10961:1149-1913(-)